MAAVSLGACGGGASPGEMPSSEGEGEEIDSGATTSFFVDPNQGGQGRLVLEEVLWGRLVDVFDLDPVTGEERLRHGDFLVGEDVASDADFELTTNPLTQEASVVIQHPKGSAGYERALARLTSGLGTVEAKGTGPAELPPFSTVPRNAALSLRFSDVLDPETVGSESVRLLVGSPPSQAFAARVLTDENHGALVHVEPGGSPEFRPTRILIDWTISEVELLEDGVSGLPNGVGLPEGADPARANVAVLLPTRLDPASGQFHVLANPAGKTLDALASGPTDETRPSRPVVRAFRAGARSVLTGDPHNGFLRDDEPPRLLGSQPITLLSAAPVAGRPGEFDVGFAFDEPTCAVDARAGDLLDLPGAFAEIVGAPPPLEDGSAAGVRVRSAAGVDLTGLAGLPGLFVAAFDEARGHVPECFVTAFPGAQDGPLTGLDPSVEIALRFSEPMDPTALNGLEGFVVTRTEDAPGPSDVVVARVDQAPDLGIFVWRPELPLSHVQGQSEAYFARMGLEGAPLTDLAGNALANPLPLLRLELDAGAPTDRSGGFVLRFTDLDADDDGLPELRGQFLHQPQLRRIVPRPVSRFSLAADRERPTVANMQDLPHPTFASPHDAGVTEPLNPMGSRVMTVWRTADLGLSPEDEAYFNIDVEGLNWAPRDGTVVADNLEQFSITLAHAGRLPDEAADLGASSIFVPGSGLVSSSFSDNALSDAGNVPVEVHSRHEGYTIDPSLLFTSAGDVRMVPFPMNEGKAPGERRFYTWRDTAIQHQGGADGLGIPIGGLVNAGELASMDLVGTVAPAGAVPSIGLPLLMDFKNWPGSGSGHNFMDTVLGGFPTSFGFALPANFRVFSTGGVDTNADVVQVDPSSDTPTGGFNQVPALGTLGTPTQAADSLFYIGQVDFVTRVSRLYSIWVDTGSPDARWIAPLTVPAPNHQPPGTAVEFAYRGALSVVGPAASSAFALDAYGDEPGQGLEPDTYTFQTLKNPNVSFTLPDGYRWRPDPADLDGSRFFQNRITFVSNAASGETPELRAVGFAYDLPD